VPDSLIDIGFVILSYGRRDSPGLSHTKGFVREMGLSSLQ